MALMRAEVRARRTQHNLANSVLEHHSVFICFEELYLEMVRKTTVFEGFRHARAAARACGPHGII